MQFLRKHFWLTFLLAVVLGFCAWMIRAESSLSHLSAQNLPTYYSYDPDSLLKLRSTFLMNEEGLHAWEHKLKPYFEKQHTPLSSPAALLYLSLHGTT